MLVELFVARPALAPEMLTDVLGMDLPRFDGTAITSADATEVTPTEYRADAVITLTEGDRPVLAVIVEAQLRPDPAKRWSWPVYVTTLRARLRCPVVLLLVCVDNHCARWGAEPIGLGNPRSSLRPLVLGPGQVPLVTGIDQAARTPELTVLSAMAHGARPERPTC